MVVPKQPSIQLEGDGKMIAVDRWVHTYTVISMTADGTLVTFQVEIDRLNSGHGSLLMTVSSETGQRKIIGSHRFFNRFVEGGAIVLTYYDGTTEKLYPNQLYQLYQELSAKLDAE